MISKVSVHKKEINFADLPQDVVRSELTNCGVRSCNLTKKRTAELIEFIWKYKKRGHLPENWTSDLNDIELQNFKSPYYNNGQMMRRKRRFRPHPDIPERQSEKASGASEEHPKKKKAPRIVDPEMLMRMPSKVTLKKRR